MSGEHIPEPRPITVHLDKYERLSPGLERLRYMSEASEQIRAERAALKAWAERNSTTGPVSKQWKELRKTDPIAAAKFLALNSQAIFTELDLNIEIQRQGRR